MPTRAQPRRQHVHDVKAQLTSAVTQPTVGKAGKDEQRRLALSNRMLLGNRVSGGISWREAVYPCRLPAT